MVDGFVLSATRTFWCSCGTQDQTIDHLLFECEIFTFEDEGNTFFFETSRNIHPTQNVQYQKTGIPVKYATPKTSNQAGFCRTMDATILSRHCPSWAAHVSVSGAAFIVWRVQHTREIWRRSGECWGSGSCRFYGFFACVVWRVFNKLRFSRSSQLYEKSLQC